MSEDLEIKIVRLEERLRNIEKDIDDIKRDVEGVKVRISTEIKRIYDKYDARMVQLDETLRKAINSKSGFKGILKDFLGDG